LVTQLIQNSVRSRSKLPTNIIQFYNAEFDIGRYYGRHKYEINITAAQAYILDSSCADAIAEYNDTIDSLYFEFCENPEFRGIVKRFVRTHEFPADLLMQWDEIVCSQWIQDNYSMMWKFDTEAARLKAFKSIHLQTRGWYYTQHRTIVRRRVRRREEGASVGNIFGFAPFGVFGAVAAADGTASALVPPQNVLAPSTDATTSNTESTASTASTNAAVSLTNTLSLLFPSSATNSVSETNALQNILSILNALELDNVEVSIEPM
jgi:hypothetical protein